MEGGLDMFINLRRLFEWIILVIIFFLLTLFLYDFFNMISDLISPINNYKEPLGKSIKVFDMSNDNSSNFEQFIERLKVFYWIGE